MTWLLLATGFTGALTVVFLVRLGLRTWLPTPSWAAYHAPKGGCIDAVVREVKQARQEILVLAQTFRCRPLAEALAAAKGRGVHVEMVLDAGIEKDAASDLGYFLEQELAPLIDAEHPEMHEHVVVIDERTVITGSWAFTDRAETEGTADLLVLQAVPDLARSYRLHFTAHKGHSRAPQSKGEKAAERKAA